MNTAKRSGLLEAHLSTRSPGPSVGYSTETSCPGPLAPLCGVASSLPGDELVAGSLLILLFAGALLIPFERLIPQEQNGSKSLPSTNTDSLQKKNSGGTERGQYDEE